MWFFWTFALVPIFAGLFFLWKNKQVCWQEWLGSCAVALVMAGIFQMVAMVGMTDDTETWSGYGNSARQYSRWKEYYEYAVYRTEVYYTTETHYTTDSKGRSRSHTERVRHTREVFDHWQPSSRWHNASWTLFTTLGNFSISETKFDDMCGKYDDRHSVPGRRTTSDHNSKMIDVDPNDYVADNKTKWIEPATTIKHFENKIKAAPSLFSFSKVPTNIAVYPWPSNPDWNRSDRVMGTAQSMIDPLKWDQLNAVLGASKKVNLIVIGFPADKGVNIAKWQEAKWIGGKKNDLVICFGGGSKTQPAEWAYVFGWTEKNIVKLDIQDLFTKYPINNDLLPHIQGEVIESYVTKDWHKFDYIKIEPPSWSYWVYLIVMGFTQAGLYFWFNVNEYDGTDAYGYRRKEITPTALWDRFVGKCQTLWNIVGGTISKFFLKQGIDFL